MDCLWSCLQQKKHAMKILQVNSVYRKGSTGKIVYDIHTELQRQRIDSVVCYGRGEKCCEQNVYKVCPEWYSKLNNLWSRVTGVMYGGLYFSTHSLIKIIEREKPDIVHLHCINGYFVNIYKIVRYLNLHHIKTVLTLHAEFMHTANCGYAFECEKWKSGCGHCPRFRQETKSFFIDGSHRSWKLMKYAFDGFGDRLIVTSVSPWLENRARQSPILSNVRHVTVLNGLDTNVFRLYGKDDCRKQFSMPLDKKIVFHANPYFSLDKNSIKGGYYVCELARLMSDVLFLIAGRYETDIDVPDNVKLLGQISDQNNLAKLYSLSDVTLLTSKRETFSMVTAESLCCGTPIVGFKAGAPEMIALPEYSKFVDYGVIDDLKVAVYSMLCNNFDRQDVCFKAQQKYAKENMVIAYIDVYRKLMQTEQN